MSQVARFLDWLQLGRDPFDPGKILGIQVSYSLLSLVHMGRKVLIWLVSPKIRIFAAIAGAEAQRVMRVTGHPICGRVLRIRTQILKATVHQDMNASCCRFAAVYS